tara:strand:+ start:62 stop:961 length:900 start_codon:yes stop_codon:yes gene_type:complete
MEHLHSNSYVVSLCYGAFLQKEVNFGNGLYLLPMKPVYEECLVNYVSVTCKDFQISVDNQNLKELHNQTKDTRPVSALIVTSELIFGEPGELEESFEKRIYKLKLITSFISGDPLIEFARLIKNDDKTFFRMIPWQSRKRQKLFFSKEEATSFFETASKISLNQEYYLSLLYDANHERNPLFRIARYFGVLEAISNSYKQPEHKGSKDQIRYMLYDDKSKRNTIKGQMGAVKYHLDPIEIAYRFRNKFFHGGEPVYEYFEDLMPQEIWNELHKNSNTVINSLQSHCEIQLMKEINKNKA